MKKIIIKMKNIYIKSVVIHILKELQNDWIFQIKKITLRIKFKLYGIVHYKKIKYNRKKISNYIIVIYSNGKSGSSSIYYTLMKCFPFNKFFHVHYLSDYWIKEKFPNTPHERNVHKAKSYFNYISKRNRKSKVFKYITLVREPVARDISSFFQNYRLMNIKFDNNDLDSIRNKVFQRGHVNTIMWFDNELYNYTGFDIYKTKFDKNKGYSIYQIDSRHELLVMRTDKLNQIFNVAMREFLGIDIDKLFSFNISANKKDGNLINQIKRYYYLNNKQIYDIYNSKFVKHFFTDIEIKQYIHKWSKKSN